MSRAAKLGITAGALLVAAVGVNWALGYNIKDMLRGYEPAPPPVAHATAPRTLPKPRGPENAPVKITVFALSGEPCPVPLMDAAEKAYGKFPGVLRVVYKDLNGQDARALATKYKITCQMGLLVNDKNRFRIRGRKPVEVILFQGPPHEAPAVAARPSANTPPTNSHGVPGYTIADLFFVIRQELRAGGINPDKLPKAQTSPERNAPNGSPAR